MHHRGTRAWVVALGLAGLLVPTAWSAATPKHKLRDARGELHALRHDLVRERRKATVVKRRIDRLGRAITEVQMALNRLDAEIDRIATAVRSEQARIDRAQAAIAGLRDLAADQAVTLYKSGSTEVLDALLDSSSIADLDERVELLGIAARENTGALIRYGRLRVEVEMSRRELFAEQRRLTAAGARQERVLERRDRLRGRLGAQLRTLTARIGNDEAREGHLERAAATLKKKIVAAQAARAAASLGTSRQGFIWPLNGPVTSPFGPRWGSMHTGIDIDGYTGQPIVAAKDGVVIYRGAGMTGYGNAVVLDHGGGISTLYAHMSGYAVGSGATVSQGKVVGYVGCTGHCFGDHLHFEVRVNGNPVDPMGYLP